MKQEFYNIAFRKKLYHNLEELQNDVEHWLRQYNENRPHSGKYRYGKTPIQTFQDGNVIVRAKAIVFGDGLSDNLTQQFRAVW